MGRRTLRIKEIPAAIDTPPELLVLLKECVDYDRFKRPMFEEVFFLIILDFF